MLRERLGPFIDQAAGRLGQPQSFEIARALLLYGLGRRNSEELRRLALQHGITDELYQLKSEFIDRTHYMASVWWRAVFEYFRRCPARNASGPDTHYVDVRVLQEAVAAVRTIKSDRMRRECASDVLLIEAFLTVQDHRQLYRLARATNYATPTELDLLPTVKKLQRYCANLVRRRMRFIIKHDNGLTAQDLENALFEAGLMTLRQYDAETNSLKLLNTAKRGAHNYFVRLVEFYTARCRSRLVRHLQGRTIPYEQDACGTCAWFDVAAPDGKSCVEDGVRPSHRPCRRRSVNNLYHARTISEAYECGNCLYYDRAGGWQKGCVSKDVGPTNRPCRSFELRVAAEQFVSTTSSLDAPVGDAQSGERAALIDFVPAPQPQPVDNEWLEQLLTALPAKQARIVSITLGQPDEHFDAWLSSRTYQSSNRFNDSQLARYACEFVGVELEEMRDVLRQYLTPQRSRGVR